MNVLAEASPNDVLKVYKNMGKAQISSENMDFMLEMMRKLELDKKLKEEGKSEEKYNIAKKLLDILDDETIAIRVGISVTEVKKLRNK